MKFNKRYTYPKTVREEINGKRHYVIPGQKHLPSVTTILDATQPEEKRQKLAQWKARVGEREAERIRVESTTIGSKMHSILEHYLIGQGELLDLSENGSQAHRMANVIIEKGLPDLEEIYGLEATLYNPEKYAGAADCVGVYQGRESIIDFKTTNRPKQDDWIHNYYHQLCLYAAAHDVVYNTEIEQGVILMVSRDLFFQKFVINGSRFRQFKQEALNLVERYYANIQDRTTQEVEEGSTSREDH
jgi:genome maintenance exonuclease 1